MEQTESGLALTDEIIEHMMHPKNYGKLDDPGGVGVGLDERSGEYVMVYIAVYGDELSHITYATNGCQDTVILGSVFTEMVKGASLDDARAMAADLGNKIAGAPAKQQACADLVLRAFDAALVNRANRDAGSGEEFHTLRIAGSCATEEEPA